MTLWEELSTSCHTQSCHHCVCVQREVDPTQTSVHDVCVCRPLVSRPAMTVRGGVVLILLLCFGTFSVGSALRCYKCADYTGRCENVQECTYEDSCLSLSERGGKTIRQCIRYTECDNSRLSQMFPSVSGFMYRCCSSNLCNSSNAVTMATPILGLMGTVLSVWWFCL